MTLPTTGTITIKELGAEFQGAGNNHLLVFYSGGSLVAANTQNGNGFLVPSSGTLTIADFYGANSANIINRLYSQAGSFTETVPTGANFVDIYVWGAGAGGGYITLITALGGGGGSGGYCKSTNVPVVAGQTFNIVVGTGGAGSLNGTSGANGANGTATTVTKTGITTMTANGGKYGGGGLTSSVSDAGGVGGTATGGTTTNTTGGSGQGGTGAVGPSGNSQGGITTSNPTLAAQFSVWGVNNANPHPTGALGGGGGNGNGNGGSGQNACDGGTGAVYFVYKR